jgi:hypothetical protein
MMILAFVCLAIVTFAAALFRILERRGVKAARKL